MKEGEIASILPSIATSGIRELGWLCSEVSSNFNVSYVLGEKLDEELHLAGHRKAPPLEIQAFL